jgi:hypothetical protein
VAVGVRHSPGQALTWRSACDEMSARAYGAGRGRAGNGREGEEKNMGATEWSYSQAGTECATKCEAGVVVWIGG